MKIAILHHDLEWTERQMERHFRKENVDVRRFDIREVTIKDLLDYRGMDELIVMNRVYASVANRDWKSLDSALKLLKTLDEKGILTINSYDGTKSDYDKFYSYNLMSTVGIRTPETILFDENKDLNEIVERLGGFPIIVKRNSGGRGLDLARCETMPEVIEAIDKIRASDDYEGGVVMQEFCNPIEGRDYRVCVFRNEILYYHGRSLVSVGDESPWIASRSLGSDILPVQRDIPADLEKFSINAANSISAELDVLDIIKTKDGYCVIEHNPTPNFRPEYEGILGFDLVKHIVTTILNSFGDSEIEQEGVADLSIVNG